MKLDNKTYDFLKEVAQVYLPALAMFFIAVAKIWGIPYAEPISVTMMAFDTFLGVVLKISSNNFYKDLIDPKPDI